MRVMGVLLKGFLLDMLAIGIALLVYFLIAVLMAWLEVLPPIDKCPDCGRVMDTAIIYRVAGDSDG